MTWRVKENNAPPVLLHVIGANSLCDAPSFPFGDIGFADSVQQRGFPVVNVAHHGYHRRAGLEIFGHLRLFHELGRFFLKADLRGGSPEIFAEVLDGV